jgi:glycosidase
MKILVKYFFLLISFSVLYGNQIKFDKVYGTEVWSHKQTITGTVSSSNFTSALIYVNEHSSHLNIGANLVFSANVILSSGMNEIYVVIDSSGTKYYSDTIRVNLGYKILPDIEANASGEGYSALLKTVILENPKELPLSFVWIEDENNPAPILPRIEGSEAVINFNSNMPFGEYYFNLFTITSEGDTTKSRTMITLNENGVKPFDIKKDHAKWIDEAVVYQTSVWAFVQDGKFGNITKKIPELADLGITTLYLQPIFQTPDSDQGYEVTDYYKINPQYGNEYNLRALIQTAKSHGLRVILDFIPNHASTKTFFGQHAIKYGSKSHYYNYYQLVKDNSPYSGEQHITSNGFVYYFDWSRMPNLNYENEEVQNYILGAAKHWVQNFDVDGFRFDAVWGITARSPEFTKKLRLVLKRIKPEILLLAEDKAAQAQVFDERFDAAYDWAASYQWVSQWSWQTVYSPYKTVFMEAPEQRSKKLRSALTNNGDGYAPNAKILRFLENNDTPRFISNHQIDRTKMAAGLLFTLNGIPMMFNGQEVGNTTHPYDMWLIYSDGRTIKSYDKNGLFDHYKNLMSIRKNYHALSSDNFEEISVDPGASVFGFRRWHNSENIFVVMNMSVSEMNVKLNMPIEKLSVDTSKIYYLTNLMNGEVKSGKPSEFQELNLVLNKYSTNIYLFTDTVAVVVGIDEEDNDYSVPTDFVLHQNYPNPFNPTTTINYDISNPGLVTLKIYDVLGCEVASLVNEHKSIGKHSSEFNASHLASGIYLYRIEQNGNSLSKKMLLIK